MRGSFVSLPARSPHINGEFDYVSDISQNQTPQTLLCARRTAHGEYVRPCVI